MTSLWVVSRHFTGKWEDRAMSCFVGCISRAFFCCREVQKGEERAEFLHMSYMWHLCLYTLVMLAFFATEWHCGLEFSLWFTKTSRSFPQHRCFVIVLHSLFPWLFAWDGKSICGVQQGLCCSSQIPHAGEVWSSPWLVVPTSPCKVSGRALNQVRAPGPWQPGLALPSPSRGSNIRSSQKQKRRKKRRKKEKEEKKKRSQSKGKQSLLLSSLECHFLLLVAEDTNPKGVIDHVQLVYQLW